MSAMWSQEPPHNVEAEQALLGAMLMAPETAVLIRARLQGGDFYYPAHGHIFDRLLNEIDEGRRPDPIVFKDLFIRDDSLSEVGGPSYIARLAASVVTTVPAVLEAYIHAVADSRRRRLLSEIGSDLARSAASPETATQASLVAATIRLEELRGGSSALHPITLADFLSRKIPPRSGDARGRRRAPSQHCSRPVTSNSVGIQVDR